MSAQDRNKARAEEDRARAALSHVLSAGKLPEKAAGPAQAMLDRLNTPVRISIMGLPGTGRSQVFNLLAGANIVPALPDGQPLPTIELVNGPQSRAWVTLPDGSIEERDDIDLEDIARQSPVMVKLEADMPALKRISLLEVVAGPDQLQQARALAWASKRTDLAIWCTRDFGKLEQQIWEAAPDALRADGILLRTHADLLREPAALLRVLRYNSGDGFDQILAVDTPSALRARDAEGGPDRKTFKSSGGQGVISAVLRMVERQRALVVDQADLLLMRHIGTTDPMRPGATADAVEEAAPVETGPVDETTAVEAALVDATPAEDAKPKRKVERPSRRVRSKRIEPEAKPVDPVRAALEAAINRLASAGRDLEEQTTEAADIMDRSSTELMWLSEHLEETEADGIEPLRSRAMDAADLVQLMQLEDSADAATEAVALMIQMRRTLSQELALKPAA